MFMVGGNITVLQNYLQILNRKSLLLHLFPCFIPGYLLRTHQSLKIPENCRPWHPERRDTRWWTGGAGGCGWDRPCWARASPRPNPLVQRPQSDPNSGNCPLNSTTGHNTTPRNKGIKSHKPFNSNSLLLFQLTVCAMFLFSAFLENGSYPESKIPCFCFFFCCVSLSKFVLPISDWNKVHLL